MANAKIFIGTRRANGQIASITESMEASKFIDLFKEKGEKRVLIDYSPLIEVLYGLHKSSNEEKTRNSYNSLFNYWQDAKSYEDKDYRMHCSSTLTTQANALINELQQKLQKNKNDGDLTWKLDPYQAHGVHQTFAMFKADVGMYIDALLIYIHSKASVEIGSFKKDFVLSQYGRFLEELVRDIYDQILRKGRVGGVDSFLKFLAFERSEDLPKYLELEGRSESPDDFRLQVLNEQKPRESSNEWYGYFQEISIPYDNFWPRIIHIIDEIKDLLLKIRAVNELLETLKAGGIDWDDDANSVDELRSILQLTYKNQ